VSVEIDNHIGPINFGIGLEQNEMDKSKMILKFIYLLKIIYCEYTLTMLGLIIDIHFYETFSTSSPNKVL
jgi:hypothetical protein